MGPGRGRRRCGWWFRRGSDSAAGPPSHKRTVTGGYWEQLIDSAAREMPSACTDQPAAVASELLPGPAPEKPGRRCRSGRGYGRPVSGRLPRPGPAGRVELAAGSDPPHVRSVCDAPARTSPRHAERKPPSPPAPGPPRTHRAEPHPARTIQAAPYGLRLLVVRGEVETDPVGDVLVRAESGTPALQLAVVLPGIAGAPEPGLDRGELGGQFSFSRDHECLEGPGHTAVSIRPRVDGDEMQMRHGGPYQGVGAIVRVQPLDQFTRQRRNIGRVRRRVRVVITADAAVSCPGERGRPSTTAGGERRTAGRSPPDAGFWLLHHCGRREPVRCRSRPRYALQRCP